jgi:hypothetical protein
MIMNANGIPEQLFIEIFREAVDTIKGLRGRVETNALTKSDHRLLSQCSDVGLNVCVKLTSVPNIPGCESGVQQGSADPGYSRDHGMPSSTGSQVESEGTALFGGLSHR